MPRAGSFTTQVPVVFSPPRTSPLTSLSASTVSTPTAVPPCLSRLSHWSRPPPPPPVAPFPPQGLASSGVSQADPSPLVEPVEVSSDTSGLAEGGDPTLAATVTPRRSALLAVPPGFSPRPSSLPLQPVAVDAGAAGGGTTGGAGFGGAGSGGTECPLGTGGTGGTGACGPGTSQQEALSPERLCEWAVQWGSPGGGASRLRAGGAGTTGAGGADNAGARGSATGGTGVASVGGTGARRQETLSPERLREWAVHWGSPGGGASRAPTTRAGGARTPGVAGGSGGAAVVGAAAGSSLGGGAGRAAAAGSGGAGPGGASTGVPGVGQAGGTSIGGSADTGGTTGDTGVSGACRQEWLSPLQLREWAVRWGSPGGGAGGTGSRGVVATGAGGSGGATNQPQPSALCHLLSLLPAATEFPVAGTTPPLLFPPTDQSQPQLLSGSPLPAPAPHTEVTESLTMRREPETCASTPERTHDMTLLPSSVPHRVVLSSPPVSYLPHLPHPECDLVHAASPNVTRLLATVVTNPSFESAAASALVAELVDFATLCRLDYVTGLVFYSSCPPSVGGELALGCGVFEDRQFELECLAAAAPHLESTLLCPEGDPDTVDIPTPCTHIEAIMGTYVDKIPPHRANIVDGMWIFRVKRPPGSPPAFKARSVARGFRQREGVDFFQTFSPTPKMTTLWVLLHVAAQHDYGLHSLDFSAAFLQGSLHEAIWLRRPRGFTGSFPEGTQWSLQRLVYGLRQAPREWHDTLRTTLAALGFAPSTAEPSLFLRTDTSLPPFYVLVYVDDFVFATGDTDALALVKVELQERHTCTDLGELRSYLGLHITRDRARRTITLTKSHMVQQVLQRFDFKWSSPQPTPLSTGHSLSAPPSDESVEPSGPYLVLVGCLMYLMTCIRPDLAYPLSLLARYEALRRHRETLLGLTTRRLTGRHRGTVSASALVLSRGGPLARLLYLVPAGAMASQELRWLTYMLTDLGERPCSPPVLYVNNKAMIALCQDQRLEHRTKHIALRYFLTRELQQRGQLHLAYVATRANTADVFTKTLGSSDHQRFYTALGLVPTLPHLLVS
ncbi:unnamed protein product [Closterium sp. NIES-53]